MPLLIVKFMTNLLLVKQDSVTRFVGVAEHKTRIAKNERLGKTVFDSGKRRKLIKFP